MGVPNWECNIKSVVHFNQRTGASEKEKKIYFKIHLNYLLVDTSEQGCQPDKKIFVNAKNVFSTIQQSVKHPFIGQISEITQQIWSIN